MKELTVKHLIERLKHMDQDAIICHMELEDDAPVYNSFEIIRQVDNTSYIDDHGDIQTGNVVAFY
jgi:hypothetical protein